MLGFTMHGFWSRLSLTLFLAASGAGSAPGQAGGAHVPRDVGRPAGALRDARAGYIKATEEYRKSLRELLALLEKGAARETSRVEKLRGLYGEGLVSRRELESAEGTLAEGVVRIKDVRLQLEGADHFLAEALFEDERPEPIRTKPGSLTSTGVVIKSTHIRFTGSGSWLLSDAVRVESFFAARFGRRLPVSAYGQSDLHTRWGFDHRQSLDVGLHPDSQEGRALIDYLRGAGIPFIAFRSAVPGSATGPHIHIGRPSHRWRGR
jgi:hypothetical protein